MRFLLGVFLLSAATAVADDVDVYLLSGQSNMQGVGSVAELPDELSGRIAGAHYWNGEQFEPLVVGETKTAARETQFGPEVGFAAAMASDAKPVYLVKYFASGQPLFHGWNSNRWAGVEPGPGRRNFYPGESADDANVGTLYSAMVKRYRAALENLEAAGQTPIVRGFVWMQGEQDAKNELSATLYGESLKRLRNRLAEDVGAKSPMPMVFGQVLPYEPAMDRFTHRTEIRQAMANADQGSGHEGAIANVKMVSTDPFPLTKDTVHYNADGLVQMGRAFAAAMKSLNADSTVSAGFPGKKSKWQGFDRYDFEVDGQPVLVVAPDEAAAGKPWVWHGEFFGHKPAPDIELLKRGYHIVYMRVPNMLGCPQAVEHWNAFYNELTTQHGFAEKAALVGLSRGGLYCYNWAAANPNKVACLYGDAPVCDFKSWPGGKGSGKGSEGEWKRTLAVYGFADEAEAMDYGGNPIDNLKPLAEAGVPLLHVYGDADDVVPWVENTGVVAERYKQLGGSIKLIGKPGVGHHPHGLDDSTPIVEFIVEHTK